MTTDSFATRVGLLILGLSVVASSALAVFGVIQLVVDTTDDDEPTPECAAEDEVVVTLDDSLYCVHIDALRAPR